MAELSPGARDLLSQPIPAWLTTVRADGSLHSTVLWVDVEGDDVICNTSLGRVKERNMRRNPHVSISVLDPEDTHHLVSVSGEASFELESGDAVIDRLAKKYLGVDSYPHRDRNQTRVTVRIHPTSVVYNGPDL